MYEDYLEDYVYKLMAKVAARFCRIFRRRRRGEPQNTETNEVLGELTNTEVNEVRGELPSAEEVRAIEATNGSGDSENIRGSVALKTKPKSKCTLNVGDSTSVVKEATTAIDEEATNSSTQENTAETEALVPTSEVENNALEAKEDKPGDPKRAPSEEIDDCEDLHFHMMMFYLWMVVTLVNVPVLITWARNFK